MKFMHQKRHVSLLHDIYQPLFIFLSYKMIYKNIKTHHYNKGIVFKGIVKCKKMNFPCFLKKCQLIFKHNSKAYSLLSSLNSLLKLSFSRFMDFIQCSEPVCLCFRMFTSQQQGHYNNTNNNLLESRTVPRVCSIPKRSAPSLQVINLRPELLYLPDQSLLESKHPHEHHELQTALIKQRVKQLNLIRLSRVWSNYSN